MPYLQVADDGSIADISLTDNGGILVENIESIVYSQYGHSVFDYIDGVIVLNQSRFDVLDDLVSTGRMRDKLISLEKDKAIRAIIDSEVVRIQAMNKTDLELAIKNGGI